MSLIKAISSCYPHWKFLIPFAPACSVRPCVTPLAHIRTFLSTKSLNTPINYTMASARLERLRKLVQADVDALPDRPVSPHSGSDDEGSGGVSLEPDLPRPISPSNKQIVSNETDSSIKPAPEPITTDDDSERRFLWLKDAKSSYNPKPLSMPPTSPPEAPNLPSTTRQRGDLASFRQDFTPIQALAKYPYKFCNKSNSQDIASAFFDQGKFWDREWDL